MSNGSVSRGYSVSYCASEDAETTASPDPSLNEAPVLRELEEIAARVPYFPRTPRQDAARYGGCLRDHINKELTRLYVARERVLALLRE